MLNLGKQLPSPADLAKSKGKQKFNESWTTASREPHHQVSKNSRENPMIVATNETLVAH